MAKESRCSRAHFWRGSEQRDQRHIENAIARVLKSGVLFIDLHQAFQDQIRVENDLMLA